MHSLNTHYSKQDCDQIIDLKSKDGLKIAVGNIYSRCKDEQKRMMYSFVEDYPTVEVMLLIDGTFEFLTVENEFHEPISAESDDGTNEMIDTFIEEQNERGSRGIKVYRECIVGNEFEKRQRYVELCQVFNCNVLLIVDSDEYILEDPRIQISKDWNSFRRRLKGAFDYDHNVYDMSIVHSEYGGRSPHNRIWINPYQMTYWKGSHYKYVRINDPHKDQSLFAKRHGRQPTWYQFDEITLKHDHNLRTDEHFYFRRIYQNYLIQYEHLLESGYSIEMADHIARIKMKNMQIVDKCTCKRCVIRFGINPFILYDQRPKIMRSYDPLQEYKDKVRQDPEFAKTLRRKFE